MPDAKLIRLCCMAIAAVSAVSGQTKPYQPGDYQTANPAYPKRNPFYFEGRIDYDLLKITVPGDAWEFAQRGIYRQDDLEDIPAAISDYRESIARNNLSNGTCQLITAAPTGFGQTTNPPPCMFTVRLRLGHLLQTTSPSEAIGLFREVLVIDPLRLGVNALIGETYSQMAKNATDDATKTADLKLAVTAYQAELALSPVTPLSVQLTGDQANNAHVHWELAEVYEELGQDADVARELDLYLKATQWHSDTYAWRIQLAKQRLSKLTNPKIRRRTPTP